MAKLLSGVVAMISRRQLAAAGVLVLGSAGGARAQPPTLRPTGQETLGPYYPIRTPRGHDMDLTRHPGRQGRALGQVVEIRGRVLDTRGRALPAAQLLVWQANAA